MKKFGSRFPPLVTRSVTFPFNTTFAMLPLVSRRNAFSYVDHPRPEAIVNFPRSVVDESAFTWLNVSSPDNPSPVASRALIQ